jgi:hypothetical protein
VEPAENALFSVRRNPKDAKLFSKLLFPFTAVRPFSCA